MGGIPWVPFTLTMAPAVIASVVDKHKATVKTVVGGFIYGLILAGLASWRSDIASGFAWLVALTSMAINGPVVFNAISKAVS